MVTKKQIITLVGIIFIVTIALFIIVPFVPLLIWSFTKQWPWPHFLPEHFSTDAWAYVFSPSGKGIEGLKNSIVVALFTLVMNILMGIPAARVLAQRQFVGKLLLFIIFLSPLFIPYTAAMIGMYSFSLKIAFLNEYIRVTAAHVLITIPYFIATIWYQYRFIGTNLQEAAKSLGAGETQIFFLVELPQLIPALSLASVFVFIISLSQYLPTWIMSGGTMLTLPVIIFPFASSGDASIVAAYSLWFFMPVILAVITHIVAIFFYRK